MLSSLVVSVFLRQSEVYEERFVTVLADSHQEVVWLDVAVDDALLVNLLDALDHLNSDEEACF